MTQDDFIRNSISGLLDDDFTAPSSLDNEDNTLKFTKTPVAFEEKQSAIAVKAKERATKVMDTLLRLYVSNGFIEKNEYVKAKVALDASTLSSVMKQLEVADRAIDILMENIELGDINPKFFDSLGNLQRTIIELIKTQSAIVITAKEEYEKMGMERDTEKLVDEVTNEGNESSPVGFKSNSGKDIMSIIRGAINEKGVE